MERFSDYIMRHWNVGSGRKSCFMEREVFIMHLFILKKGKIGTFWAVFSHSKAQDLKG